MMTDRRKRLSNSSERHTAQALRDATRQHGCVIYEKVRIADTLDIQNSGLTDQEYRYALQSHFDFVLAQESDTRALFAVEFDGPHHTNDPDSLRRDQIKDQVCKKLGMPLLRVDGYHLKTKVGRFELLRYLIDVWFKGEAFTTAQENGYIPSDEDFDPNTSIIEVADGRIRFPYHPSRDAIELFHRLHARGITRPMVPVTLRGHDKNHIYDVCMALTYVKGGVLFSFGCIKAIDFGYAFTFDLAEDIAVISLAQRVGPYLEGHIQAAGYEEVEREFRKSDFSPMNINRDENGLPDFWYTSTGRRPVRT